MGAALPIRDELTPEGLRRRARHEPNRRAALRMLAIANALEGMSRAEAARLAGMERQALRDAVVRYNAEGLAGLYDRPKPGRPPRLSRRCWQRGCSVAPTRSGMASVLGHVPTCAAGLRSASASRCIRPACRGC
jgi:Winged helix-turn helix